MKHYLLILLTTLTVSSIAQVPYNKHPKFVQANKNWVLNLSSGLNFETNPPSTFSAKNGWENLYSSVSSVSDPITGRLLFYTVGQKVWDVNHQIMPNGTNLIGNGGMGTYLPDASKQNIQIVPFPNDSSKFYIFSSNSRFLLYPTDNTDYSSTDSFAIFYSVVDMKLNGGAGDIVDSQKNIPLTPVGKRYTSAMQAVPDDCGGLWLILHRHDSAIFESWHITSDGIDPNPVISRTGYPLNPIYNVYDNNKIFGGNVALFQGATMSISPNRELLTFCSKDNTGTISPYDHAHSIIAKFNPLSGVVSEVLSIGKNEIPDASLGCYFTSYSFSPNSRKLYVIEALRENDTIVGNLYQFDLSSYNKAAIDSSKQLISRVSNIKNFYVITDASLRLYRDTIFVNQNFSVLNQNLAVITNPNASGPACNYVPNLISLPDSVLSGSLPKEVAYPFNTGEVLSFLTLDTQICESTNFDLWLEVRYGGIGFSYEWNNGANTPSIQVDSSGTYWCTYSNGCYSVVDTFIVRSEPMETPVIIKDDNDILKTTNTYNSYQWIKDGQPIPGATSSTITAVEYGAYQVAVTNSAGCQDTSEIFMVGESRVYSLTQVRNQISLYPNPSTQYINVQSPIALSLSLYTVDGRPLIETLPTNNIDLSAFPAGIYFIKIMDEDGRFITTRRMVKVE